MLIIAIGKNRFLKILRVRNVGHNIHQAMRLSDYVVHLYLGKIVEHGHASGVFNNPKEDRTRAYINGTFINDLIDTESNLQGVSDRLIIYMKNLQRVKL